MAVTQIVVTLPPLAHAENPVREGYALCGRRLTGRHSSASRPKCVVCVEMARPSFTDR